MKRILLIILFSLLLASSANATLVDVYFDYGPTSTVTDENLDGNLNNIRNVINGKIDNLNIDTANGYRLFEVLGSTPAAGNQGRIVYNSTTNTLHFDTGSVMNIAIIQEPGTETQGDVLYYNGTQWIRLGQSNAGKALTTAGSSANPAWVGMTTQGDIEYHNGTTRTRLAPGTSGFVLQTQGTSANPIWVAPSRGSQVYTSGASNWTAPAGVGDVWITMCAGGGGAGEGAGGIGEGGGGGGAGECIIMQYHDVTAGSSYAYSVGALGAGGTGSGSAGGNSTFDTLATTGGGGGTAAGAGGAAGGSGVLDGAATVGGRTGETTFGITGGAGAANTDSGGGGGACRWGGGGTGGTGDNTAGGAATGLCSGGGGGSDGGGDGGAGTAGFIRINW